MANGLVEEMEKQGRTSTQGELVSRIAATQFKPSRMFAREYLKYAVKRCTSDLPW